MSFLDSTSFVEEESPSRHVDFQFGEWEVGVCCGALCLLSSPLLL